MAKKKVSKKESAPKKAQEKIKKEKAVEAEYIDWKIPAAFIAGVLITILFYSLPDFSISNDSSFESSNESSGLETQSAIEMVILTDNNCALCNASEYDGIVKMNLESTANSRIVDISSTEGQQLMALGVNSLPAVFFASEFSSTGDYEYYNQYGWVESKGNYYYLSALPGVKDLTKTESINPTIDLFIMSMCPYGTPAQKNMINLKNQIPEIELNMHYIGNIKTEAEIDFEIASTKEQYDTICETAELAQGYGLSCTEAEWQTYEAQIVSGCELKNDSRYYCSLHGWEEVYNDIIQLCAMNLSENGLDFILSHIDNGFDAQIAANASGINYEELMSCANSSKGLELFEESIAIGNELQIGASPTYIFDNVYSQINQDPASVVCSLHSQLSGCDGIESLDLAQSTGSC